MSPPNENTLGVILGRRNGRRVPEATRRAIRSAGSYRASLGTTFIGIGAFVVFGLRSVYGLAWLVGLWRVYPQPLTALAAWIVLVAVVVATVIVARARGDQLPNWMFAVFLTGLAAAVALDLWAIWPLHDVGRFGTAAVASGMALVVVVTVRRARDVLIATAALAAVLGAAIILGSDLTPDSLSQQLTTFAFAVLPPVIGVAIVDGFRGLVRRELDRVLVQSTVSAPRLAVGMLASEELARLDLAAEDLLESVASGRTPLPLDTDTASVAASLATELRLHLIQGRRETWLYHAVAESDLLSTAVTLEDTGSLAGLLDSSQRDGLLSAVWLLVVGEGKGGPHELRLTVGPVAEPVETDDGSRILVPIEIVVPRTSRNRVDSGVWEAVRRVGRYSDTNVNSNLHITVQGIVENPADQAQHHSRTLGERS